MRYICQICGYVYDDSVEKVPFSELPDTWKCPLCGAAKTDFKPDSSDVPEKEKIVLKMQNDLEHLTAGQLAALCSNLARGCEKQYKDKEAGQFRALADYFTATIPEVPDASVDKLALMLQDDIASYSEIRKTADNHNDRGTARICVWGEKVTRMLSSLVERYLLEGEELLEGTDIWVCTTCGFVYIGDVPPELCPVCKVPAWKFEKIEGRASA